MFVLFFNLFLSYENNENVQKQTIVETNRTNMRTINNISRASINNRLETIYYPYFKVIIEGEDDYIIFEDENIAKEKMEYLLENTEGAIVEIEQVVFTYLIDISSNEDIDNFLNKYLDKFKIKPKTCYPVANIHKINSNYGKRERGEHTGIDLFAKYGDDILAYKEGIVELVSYSNVSYGNQILIRHLDGTKTRYAHLSSINVSQGQQISCGEKIGEAGTTGNSTGVHLHFEIIKNNVQINPYTYIF